MTRATNSGNPATNQPHESVPTNEKRSDGQFKDHWILSDDERAKGFVRPVRLSYRHVGRPGPKYTMRDLTAQEVKDYSKFGYIKFESYPRDKEPLTGRYWTKEELDKIDKGCGTVTSMPQKIAETYAVNPGYYGRTFCCGCGDYFPVGEQGEFVWDNTDERVGT